MPSPALRRQHQHQHQHQQQEQRERPQRPQEASRLPAALALPRAAFVYTRCYCEENVYLLLAQLQTLLSSSSSGSSGQLSALFISNKIKACPVWGQQGEGEDGAEEVEREDEGEDKVVGQEDQEEDDDNNNEEGEGSPVLWDYHVVALLETDDSAFIYDLDTRLEPFPCQASEYVARAFRPDMPIKEEYRQRFRLVPFVPFFRDGFACDRSHMRRPDGSWNAPPPAYPPIRGSSAASSMTLPSFWTVDEEEGERTRGGELGEILSLADLQARVSAGDSGENDRHRQL